MNSISRLEHYPRDRADAEAYARFEISARMRLAIHAGRPVAP